LEQRGLPRARFAVDDESPGARPGGVRDQRGEPRPLEVSAAQHGQKLLAALSPAEPANLAV
jgi:hypothetical protein